MQNEVEYLKVKGYKGRFTKKETVKSVDIMSELGLERLD